MAKITLLPVAAPITGAETVVLVQDGATVRADVATFLEPAAQAAAAESTAIAAASASAADDAKIAAQAAQAAAAAGAAAAADDAAAAAISQTAAAASQLQAAADAEFVASQTGNALGAANNAAASAAIAEAAASAPGLSLIGGIGFTQRSIAVGITPANVRYEFNSGGLNAFQETVLHLATMDRDIIPMKISTWNANGKPVGFQTAVNRGDGIPGSQTFSIAAEAGDRVLIWDWYVGRGEENTGTATDQQTAFAHAGYLTCEVDRQRLGLNECPTTVFLRPGADIGFPGNGIEINSLSQTAFPGPNHPTQYGSGQDHKAILRLGPGGGSAVPLRLTPAPLRPDDQTEDGLVEGGIEFTPAGKLMVTEGLDGDLKRRAVETNQVSAEITPSGTALDEVTAIVLASGLGWAKVRLTVGAADYSTNSAVATLLFASAFSATPIVVGSRDEHGGTSADGGHEFAFNGRAANRITISLMSGTLLAGQTYCFNLLWKIP